MTVESAGAKARHACTMLDRSVAALEAWTQSDAFWIGPGGDPEVAYEAIAVRISAAVPEEVALEAGNACSGAIGALDHLAWHAYTVSGGDQAKKGGVYFPKDEKSLTADKWIQRVPEAVRSLFAQVISDGGDDLVSLRRLGNVDKHQDLHIIGIPEREAATIMPEVPEGLFLDLEVPARLELAPGTVAPIASIGWVYGESDLHVPRNTAPPLPELSATLNFGVMSVDARLSFTTLRTLVTQVATWVDLYARLQQAP